MNRRAFLAATASLAACTQLPSRRPDLDRVRDSISRMALDDKVGQVMSVAFHGPTIPPALGRIMREQRIGGVILFKENIASTSALAALVDELQMLAAEAKLPPLFISMDQEGGSIVRLGRGATVLPSQMALAATPQPVESVRRAAVVTAQESRALGINFVLAPVADVNVNPRNPVILDRSFGSDPRSVADLVTAMVGAYREAGMLCCVKHFPGHGDTTVDSHTGLPDLDEDVESLERTELIPFRAAVAAGVPAVMSAHIRLASIDAAPNVSATLSRALVTGVLRERLGFDGLALTDDLEMDAIKKHFRASEAAARALDAGADLLLFRFDVDEQRAGHREIVARVRRGDIPMERLDGAVQHVLLAKSRWGISERRALDPAAAAAQVGTEANRATALDLARQSVTLLRNRGVLPLGGKKILVISPEPAALRNDEAIVDDQLSFGAQLAKLVPVTQRTLPLRPSPLEYAGLAIDAAQHDVVVIATYMVAKYAQQAGLVNALRGLKPTAVVSLRSPYDVMDFAEIPAYLCTYHTRDVGCQAAAEVLVGARAPQGKLPVDIPGVFPIGAGMTSL
jgi:beta-N-acetylhexosaminidase